LAIKALSHNAAKLYAYTSANVNEMPTLKDLSADIRHFPAAKPPECSGVIG
jgi:hypothetical protein